MQNHTNDITIFLLVTTLLIMLMGAFILTIVFLHRKKQLAYHQKIKEIEAHYEMNLIKTQLEIQEQTSQHISRDIHDNISLSLTLAKLHLHTLDWNSPNTIPEKINNSINLLTKSIAELSDISKGLNSDVIIQHGLLKALEEEIERIRQAGLFEIDFRTEGIPVYMNNQRELFVFRIVQEAFNNIIKHSEARHTRLALNFNDENLLVDIEDDGKGFDTVHKKVGRQAGLKNMKTRIRILKGAMEIHTLRGGGTSLSFKIPFE